MLNTIAQNSFSDELFLILEETFESHHGIFLDKNTSLFDTLESISAQEASIPIGNNCSTLAAQVEHVIFYLEVMIDLISGKEVGRIDWAEIWNRVSSVKEEEWDEIKTRLKSTYQQLSDMLQNIKDWEKNDAIGISMACVMHTAYHLGEIRQALCCIK